METDAQKLANLQEKVKEATQQLLFAQEAMFAIAANSELDRVASQNMIRQNTLTALEILQGAMIGVN